MCVYSTPYNQIIILNTADQLRVVDIASYSNHLSYHFIKFVWKHFQLQPKATILTKVAAAGEQVVLIHEIEKLLYIIIIDQK